MNILTFEKGRSCGNMAKRFKQYVCVFSQAPTTSQTVHQAEWQLWYHRGVGPSEKAKSRNLEKWPRSLNSTLMFVAKPPTPLPHRLYTGLHLVAKENFNNTDQCNKDSAVGRPTKSWEIHSNLLLIYLSRVSKVFGSGCFDLGAKSYD